MSDGRSPRRAAPTAVGNGASRMERRRLARQAQVRRRRRVALGAVLAAFVLVVAAVLWPMRDAVFGGGSTAAPADFAAGNAGGEVVVHLTGTNNSDFAQSLVDAGVVRSVEAFNAAAGNQPISAGYYELRRTLPAAEAVDMIIDPDRTFRVGMLSVPAGAQLDDKQGADNSVSRGIVSQLSDATAHTIDGVESRIPVTEFFQAAATASADELGVPQWAAPTVDRMQGDHRRIEGLIAPGVWEDVDPAGTPVSILRSLIEQSTAQYEAQGLLSASRSSAAELDPYEVLVSASIVEREVNQPDDYARVARVILNRLAVNQMLQMDSTINYTETVTSINVTGEQLLQETEWNTYASTGLPMTPIGAVGTDALVATENPAPGAWLYFVTVDNQGTTLFTDDFAQHERNRQVACENNFLTVGCGS